MKLIFAVMSALSPGLINWWLGRRLLAANDDATLPQRLGHLRQSLIFSVLIALITCAAVAWRQMPWLLLVLVIALLAGGFRVRKSIYQETWGLAAYLGFMPRLWLGFQGFWALLCVAPLVIWAVSSRTSVPSWGDSYWTATLTLGAILALWSHFHGRVLLGLLRCVPLAGAALDPYRDTLARINERSSAPAPDLWLLPMSGGRWVNAIALPSVTTPRVVFTSSLLDTLEREEIAAIYAHEMGHLEAFTPSLLRRLRLLEISLVLLAVLAAPPTALRWLWPLVPFMTIRWMVRRRRNWETDADLRALELCGNAETLIRALTKIHRWSMLPRRLPLAAERLQTHPSLARRIQAIRRATGQPAGDVPATTTPDATTPTHPLVLRGADAETAIVLANDRIHWLEGVELETDDPQALLSEARAIRTVAYGGLVELRVDRQLGQPPQLLALEVDGQKRSFTLPVDKTDALQRALDQIDHQLATDLTPAGKKIGLPGRRKTLLSVILWMLIFGLTVILWLALRS